MKKILLIVMAFIAVACISCNKDENNNNANDPTNPGNYSTYAEIEAYCLDNGWSECSLEIINQQEDYLNDRQNYFEIIYKVDGTLYGFQNLNDRENTYKLYSSFSALLSINAAPTEGYVRFFTCDTEKFGICKYIKYSGYTTGEVLADQSGYSKFYIRRINANKIKILYKKCDWPFVE